jgi:hypothetical protein
VSQHSFCSEPALLQKQFGNPQEQANTPSVGNKPSFQEVIQRSLTNEQTFLQRQVNILQVSASIPSTRQKFLLTMAVLPPDPALLKNPTMKSLSATVNKL